MSKTKKSGSDDVRVTIAPPNMVVAAFQITGTAPYVQHKFSQKAREMIRESQKAGSTGKKGKKKDPKDFQKCFEQAQHIAEEGWNGIPAAAFRAAMVSACRICGYKMTMAKLAFMVIADGFDAEDGTPLVKITKGKPEYREDPVRLQTGVVDLRARPMWKPGWQSTVRVQFDADMFTVSDIANLLARVGCQVGIGEGRPDSKKSCGQCWGTFDISAEKSA